MLRVVLQGAERVQRRRAVEQGAAERDEPQPVSRRDALPDVLRAAQGDALLGAELPQAELRGVRLPDVLRAVPRGAVPAWLAVAAAQVRGELRAPEQVRDTP